MFSQKRQRYLSQLSRSYPILRLFDIYDRQSFIRAYVLDNVYVCIIMYIFFYVALWYANTVIKRIEKSNREMLKVVEENRTKLNGVILLKNKKAEYEEVVLKARAAQKATSKYLENEMQRLSNDLAITTNKMCELEEIIRKTIFSTKPPEDARKILEVTSPAKKESKIPKDSKMERPTRSRSGRFWNRLSRRRSKWNRQENMGFSSLDRLAYVDRILRLHPQNSDSSNCSSMQASSESVIQKRTNILNFEDNRGKKNRTKFSKKTDQAVPKKLQKRKLLANSANDITPFTKSVLSLATIFLRAKE